MEEDQLQKTILSTLKGTAKDDDAHRLKKLRKMVLLVLQMDDSDKSAKKKFKKAVKSLEDEGLITLDEDGIIELKKRKSGDSPSESRKKAKTESGPGEKNVPCKGNPQGVTRLFLGNLPFAVDEAALQTFMPGEVTHIKWITDKETGKFYGSAFIEMDNAVNAAEAVAKSGTQLMGRAVKINFAPARPGDVWPPVKKVQSGGQAGGSGVKAMSEKPENCVKLFMGNCSFDIDDDTITRFFGAIDCEVKAIRWLHHKHNDDFKGCGYVEFYNTEACSKAATLNGKNVLGRPIRLDWAE